METILHLPGTPDFLSRLVALSNFMAFLEESRTRGCCLVVLTGNPGTLVRGAPSASLSVCPGIRQAWHPSGVDIQPLPLHQCAEERPAYSAQPASAVIRFPSSRNVSVPAEASPVQFAGRNLAFSIAAKKARKPMKLANPAAADQPNPRGDHSMWKVSNASTNNARASTPTD
jgi:hypothetical protein